MILTWQLVNGQTKIPLNGEVIKSFLILILGDRFNRVGATMTHLDGTAGARLVAT